LHKYIYFQFLMMINIRNHILNGSLAYITVFLGEFINVATVDPS